MQKNSWWLIIVLIVVVSAIVLRLTTPSSRWICEGGEWVKRGNPSFPQPTETCFDEYSMEKELASLSELFNDGVINNEEREMSDKKLDELVPEDNLESDKLADLDENYIEKLPRLVQLISPQADEVIRSPYRIFGLASGTWYFEANFPIILRTSDGKVLTETYAQAQSDWMTEDLVSFEAELTFDSDNYLEGELLIIKANPSGLPEYDAQIIYPVRFVSKTYED